MIESATEWLTAFSEGSGSLSTLRRIRPKPRESVDVRVTELFAPGEDGRRRRLAQLDPAGKPTIVDGPAAITRLQLGSPGDREHQVQVGCTRQRHILGDRDVLEPLHEQGTPARVLPAAERPPDEAICLEADTGTKVEPGRIEHHDAETTHGAPQTGP
jgi:hypothetical protein